MKANRGRRPASRMVKALEAAVAVMASPRGATIAQIQDALAAADHPHTDAKALLRWARDHRGLHYDVDLDGRVRAKPSTKSG
jgi:hypothetical protein